MKNKLTLYIVLICVFIVVIGAVKIGYTIWNIDKEMEKILHLEKESEIIQIDQTTALAELIKNTPPDISKKYFEKTVHSQTIKRDVDELNKNITLNRKRLSIMFVVLTLFILVLWIIFKKPVRESLPD